MRGCSIGTIPVTEVLQSSEIDVSLLDVNVASNVSREVERSAFFATVGVKFLAVLKRVDNV